MDVFVMCDCVALTALTEFLDHIVGGGTPFVRQHLRARGGDLAHDVSHERRPADTAVRVFLDLYLCF